jgi:hypothetical protein
MPTISQDAQGNRYVPAPDGSFRRLTPEEEAAMDTSPLAAFFASGAKGTQDLVNAAGIGAGAMTGSSDIVQQQMQAMQQRQQLFDPLQRMQPGPTTGGELILNPLNLAGMGGGRAAMEMGSQALLGRAGGRMAQRVQAFIERQLAQRETQAAEAQALRGLRSVGAAEQAPEGMVGDVVTGSRTLNATQREALKHIDKPPGEPGAINLQLLPGEAAGDPSMKAAIGSDPDLLAAFEPELSARRQEAQRVITQSLGVPEDSPFTDTILTLAEDTYGPKFDAVQNAVTKPVTLSEPGQTVAGMSLDAYEKLAIDVSKPLAGEELFTVRRNLQELATSQAKAGDYTALKQTRRALDEIEKHISDQLTPELKALQSEANGNFRTKLLLEAGQVFGKSGEVNLATAYNWARKIYGKRFRSYGRRPGITDQESQMLDFIKASNAFPAPVGNSGTPFNWLSVQGVRDLLKNPLKVFADQGAARFMRRQADSAQRRINPAGYWRTPDAAGVLPQRPAATSPAAPPLAEPRAPQ